MSRLYNVIVDVNKLRYIWVVMVITPGSLKRLLCLPANPELQVATGIYISQVGLSQHALLLHAHLCNQLLVAIRNQPSILVAKMTSTLATQFACLTSLQATPA